MKRVLFCTERWCDGRPYTAHTNHTHNLFNTFSQCCPNAYNNLYIDESQQVYGQHIDSILPQYCQQYNVDIIFFSMLGHSPMNPSLNCCAALKQMGVFNAFMWPDSNENDLKTQDEYDPIIDLNIVWDNPRSTYHDNRVRKEKDLYLWVPEDTTMFHPDTQDIDVSFIGSLRQPYRAECINYAKQHVPSLVVNGGQREVNLTPYEYARLIRRSKISINFSLSPGYNQVKGRVYEILASESMLLEDKNGATSQLFTPGKDYVEFGSKADLVYKINYYLEHEDERLDIASQGYYTYIEKYSTQKFWDTIMERIENG